MNARQHDHKRGETAPPQTEEATTFPAARYFQVHFEHLYALIGDLQSQVERTNQQIESLRRIQSQDRRDIDSCLSPLIPGRRNRM